MTDYIYSRVSTDKQTVASQLTDLQAKYPDAEVVSETASGARRRPALEQLLARLQPGDRLVVAALDRLGRRASEVLRLIEDLQARSVTLVSVREGVDYSTLAGKLVTQILASVAELERGLIAERTRAGLQAARADGVRLGRPSVYSESEVSEALRLLDSGLSLRQVSALTGISRSRLDMLRRSRAPETQAG